MTSSTTNIEFNAFHVFQNHELNEPVLMVYNIIRRALIDGADTLDYDDTLGFRWSKGGRQLGEFPLDMLPTTAAFSQALTDVLTRDAQVQQHVELITSENGRRCSP